MRPDIAERPNNIFCVFLGDTKVVFAFSTYRDMNKKLTGIVYDFLQFIG